MGCPDARMRSITQKLNCRQPRILIVDDEEIVRVALGETLRREGYEVMTAANGLQALELLEQGPVSAVLTDLQMPQMTGLDFLGQVRKVQPEAIRIVITARLSLSTVIEAINKGEIYRIIIKPWLREELLAAVKSAVQRYESTRRDQGLQTSALANNLEHSLNLCVRIMETAYPALGCQARRVHEICQAMAEANPLSAGGRQILDLSAWLYDVGLVVLPPPAVKQWQQSPETLTDAELATMQRHPILGQELVRFEPPLDKVGAVIRGHHERFDGTGYPDRLRGDSIPWLSRWLAVVIAFVESELAPDAAAVAIKRGSGTVYDPEAVDCFLRGLHLWRNG
jgi:response regulator RpfG family c-di-GMP phosphodiesterase